MEINTLVADIYDLFNPNKTHEPCEENLEDFAQNLKTVLRTRLSSRDVDDAALRFSALGRPDRQVWYRAQGEAGEEMSSQTYFKFLYGDVLEQVLLFLAKESGHRVEHTQGEVEVDGVKGHIDAIIDGVVVDVKSASPYGFKKFKDGSLLENDPFGYVQQLSGYANVLTPGSPAAFLAFDKVSGEICLSTLSSGVIKDHPPAERIAHLKAVIANPDPPIRCYDDVADGASGNRKLDTGCSYCAFKFKCWPDLRTFIYSTGPRYLTTVKSLPKVYEVVDQG